MLPLMNSPVHALAAGRHTRYGARVGRIPDKKRGVKLGGVTVTTARRLYLYTTHQHNIYIYYKERSITYCGARLISVVNRRITEVQFLVHSRRRWPNWLISTASNLPVVMLVRNEDRVRGCCCDELGDA